MSDIIGKMRDGGILITYPVVILLFVCIGLFIWARLKPEGLAKAKALIASIGWFVLAWGYMGRTIGLIRAFDNVAVAGRITPELLSGGLKMALVGPLIALFTFIVARILIFVLILRAKKEDL